MSNSEHENYLQFDLRTPDGTKTFTAENFTDLNEIANKFSAEEKHEYLLESVKIDGLQMADDQSIRTFQNLFDYMQANEQLQKFIEGDTIYNKNSRVGERSERPSVLGKLQEAKENVAAKSGDGSVNKEVNREAAAR